MFLSKKLFNSSFKGIKISYIIIEVVLIFIGVTFANLAYEKSLEKKDKKFITENLLLYRSELTSTIQQNERHIKFNEESQEEFIEFHNMFKDVTISENELLDNQKGFFYITIGLIFPTKQSGFKNIINRDISLIKDFDFINKLGTHLLLLDHKDDALDYYNKEIYKLYELFVEHINMDFENNKITGFKNLEDLRNDVQFNNQLNQVIYLRKHYINDMRVLNEKYFNKMIESIDEYLN